MTFFSGVFKWGMGGREGLFGPILRGMGLDSLETKMHCMKCRACLILLRPLKPL